MNPSSLRMRNYLAQMSDAPGNEMKELHLCFMNINDRSRDRVVNACGDVAKCTGLVGRGKQGEVLSIV